MRNLRKEIEVALAGGAPDNVPFTFYDLLLPPGFDRTPLQKMGMAICARRNVFRKVMPNVKVERLGLSDGTIQTHYRTPVGSLDRLDKRAETGTAPLAHPIKKREDYVVAEFIVRDTRYEPNYEGFLAGREEIGDSGITIGHTGYAPLLDIQLNWVGQERFCYELVDNEDALMGLHDALVESHKPMYDVVANGPADHILYGGNIVPEMIGPDRIREHVLPCWQAFADRLHAKDKNLGVHLDADNRLILDLVRESPLDFIEAFTPPPDCSVSVAEARTSWPGKRLWINFPSSVHLQSDEAIRQATRDILEQAGDRKGFLIGITEDIPPEHIERSVSAILEVLSAG